MTHKIFKELKQEGNKCPYVELTTATAHYLFQCGLATVNNGGKDRGQ